MSQSVFDQLRAIDPDAHAALETVAAECIGQRQREGWMPEHDDCYRNGELAVAGGCYAQRGGGVGILTDKLPLWWPWDARWWKPKTPWDDLTRGAALVVAEMGRLLRAKAAQSDCTKQAQGDQ